MWTNILKFSNHTADVPVQSADNGTVIRFEVHNVTIFQMGIPQRRCCHLANLLGPYLIICCVITIFQRINTYFDLVATNNHSQQFTNNKHMLTRPWPEVWGCEAWKYKQSGNKSCGEDEFKDESMFYHTNQQLNIFHCLRNDVLLCKYDFRS